MVYLFSQLEQLKIKLVGVALQSIRVLGGLVLTRHAFDFIIRFILSTPSSTTLMPCLVKARLTSVALVLLAQLSLLYEIRKVYETGIYSAKNSRKKGKASGIEAEPPCVYFLLVPPPRTRRTLELFCAKNRSKKHQIFEKRDHFGKGPSCKGYNLCKIVSLGQKLKMPKTWGKRFCKNIRVVLCKKTARKNTKYSRNETILKIGHLAKAIAFLKWSFWVKN